MAALSYDGHESVKHRFQRFLHCFVLTWFVVGFSRAIFRFTYSDFRSI